MLALVTGGDRGIGFAIAHKLAENGYDVVIAARNKNRLAEAKAKLSASGANVRIFACDLTKIKQIKKLVRDVSKLGNGAPDVLVNDAGVAFNKELLENSEEEIDLMLDVNLRGLIHCTKEFLPAMIKRKGGVSIIINISSGAGKVGFPGLAVYCATKFGVIGFTESLAQEVKKDGVLVYAICPGATDTDMWRSLYPGQRADYAPEDVAIEVLELIKNAKRVRSGSAIDVRKHI